MGARTSADAPLRVDFVSDVTLKQLGVEGRIGMTIAPGKHQRGGHSGDWARDLDADLARLRELYATDLLVTLLPGYELQALKIPNLLERARAHGLETRYFPFDDGSVPDRLLGAYVLIERLVSRLRAGGTIVVHCKGGLGRSGLVVASVLIALGLDHEAATTATRAARRGAIETPAQGVWVREFETVWAEDPLADRFEGCLLGGAVGDALGAGIEFQSLASLRERYGPGGITDFVPAYGHDAPITDDTQMTLFTAEGLLRSAGQLDDVDAVTNATHRAYLRWLHTQGEASHFVGPGYVRDGWLFGVEGLHHPRAPGGTCLGALRGPTVGTVGAPLNDSKGCGGVMRMAPVGLVLDDPYEHGCALAAITHGHPSGYIAAGVFADIVARIVRGASIEEAARSSVEGLDDRINDEVRTAMNRALHLAASGEASTERVIEQGEGWVAEEALGIGLYCALVAEDFGHGVLLAVNHSGDSDSTGAIAGNLLGAALGTGGISPQWLFKLELREVIQAVARDLRALRAGAPVDEQRYPRGGAA